jgi:hypothetical protein
VADLIKVFTSKGFARIVFISFGFCNFQYKLLDNDLMISQKLSNRVEDLVIIGEKPNPRQVLCLFNYLEISCNNMCHVNQEAFNGNYT